MNYNKTHGEYRLGIGLYFKLKYNHQEFAGGWTALSNIPGIDLKKLESQTQEDAVYEVMGLIQAGIEFEYDEFTVSDSIPKKYERVIYSDNESAEVENE